MLWMAVCLIVSFTGCTSEEMDYNNPDVALFVKQLKSGTYKMKNDKGVVEVPHFTEEDIPELLKYAEDLTIIPSFPSVYNMNNGKIRLGECMLWVIESIRQGTPPSLGCKMVLANAENYEAIYFLTDEEVLDAAACYRSWWEERQYPKTRWTIDPCYDEPLCGSGYRWWYKGGAFGKQKIGNIHVGTFVCISSLMLLTGDYYAQKTASRRRI